MVVGDGLAIEGDGDVNEALVDGLVGLVLVGGELGGGVGLLIGEMLEDKLDEDLPVGLNAGLVEVGDELEEALVLVVHVGVADIEGGVPDEGGGDGEAHGVLWG